PTPPKAAQSKPSQMAKAETPAIRAAAPAQRTAQLVLAVFPGGDLYIDGKHLGSAPEITTFDLAPGMYRVEVRSGSHKPYLTYMTLEPGDVRRIRHDFDAKPSRPPT